MCNKIARKGFLGAPIAAVLILSACAGIAPGVEPPPASYAHKTPAVEVRIMELYLRDMNAACRAAGVEYAIYGCTYLYPRLCLVFAPVVGNGGITQESRDEIEAHEIYGHCNGLKHGPDRKRWFFNGREIV